MNRFFVSAPRWLLLVLLVFAPWAYGSVRPWTIQVLSGGMLVLLLLWAGSSIARRLRPMVPTQVWAAVAFLVLYGWWMCVNARQFYDRTALEFVDVTPLLSFAPGAVDRADAMPLMARLSYLLGILCFSADLSQRPEWRRRIALTIAGSGALLILFGLVQRILGAPMIFWERTRVGENFFATYFYHGNAGAFINLVLPVIAGFSALAVGRRDGGTQRAIWYPALLVAIAGALAAASKAAVIITFLILIAMVLWRRDIPAKIWKGLPSPALRALALVTLVLALLALGWFGWARLEYRWAKEAWGAQSVSSRLLTYQVCWTMIGDSGPWGFGAGNFMIAFPHYTTHLGNKLDGIWRFAHEDYLQTVIEWGWVGAAGWALLFVGGLTAGVRALRRRAAQYSEFDRTLLFAVLLAMFGVCLHATVDFPLQIASLQFYAVVYLGILWGSGRWRKAEDGRPV